MTADGQARDVLRVGRVEVVDERGVVRASLAAGDDGDARRIGSAAGLLLFDTEGREVGGTAHVDVAGGRVVSALDGPQGEVLSSVVTAEGDAWWVLRSAGTPRILARVADDVPALSLLDDQGRPRLRLTLTETGAGALEFLRADGSVASSLIPEDGSPA